MTLSTARGWRHDPRLALGLRLRDEVPSDQLLQLSLPAVPRRRREEH